MGEGKNKNFREIRESKLHNLKNYLLNKEAGSNKT